MLYLRSQDQSVAGLSDRLWDAGLCPALTGEMETQRWPRASLSHGLKELQGNLERVLDWV